MDGWMVQPGRAHYPSSRSLTVIPVETYILYSGAPCMWKGPVDLTIPKNFSRCGHQAEWKCFCSTYFECPWKLFSYLSCPMTLFFLLSIINVMHAMIPNNIMRTSFRQAELTKQSHFRISLWNKLKIFS